jgi:DNA adenine methylase
MAKKKMGRPFLKWAGSKYRIIDHIQGMLPEGERLVEPFAGSGAVFLNTDYNRYLLADNNADLISLYQILSSQGEVFTIAGVMNSTKPGTLSVKRPCLSI